MITIRLGTLSSPGHSQLTPMAPGPEAQAQKREVCVTGIWQQHPENQNGHEVSLHCALKLPHENVLATRNLLGNLWTTAKLQINAFSLSTSWFWESHHPLPPGHWGRQRSVMFYKTNWRKCKASCTRRNNAHFPAKQGDIKSWIVVPTMYAHMHILAPRFLFPEWCVCSLGVFSFGVAFVPPIFCDT